MTRPRKQSIVPDTPTFAIRDAAWGARPRAEPSRLLPAVSDTFAAGPAIMTRMDSNGIGSSSRWSSGSESDGESAMSIKSGRKFSKGRKSLAASRKNSVAALREASEMSPESGARQARRSSKSRTSGQTDTVAQVLSVPSKPALPSLSKRLLLNGLPNLRKKSFPNLNDEPAIIRHPTNADLRSRGWSSAPHASSMTPKAAFSGSASQDKSLPPSPLFEAASTVRSRSRTAEIAPPKNLRHLRQFSSNANLKTLRKIVPGDVFKSHQANITPVNSADVASPSSTSVANEEPLPAISGSASQATAMADEPAGSIKIVESIAPFPILVDRRQAKMKKARRIRKQNDRFPRHNSWSDLGLQWIAEQGADAFERLAAEGLPSSVILMAAGASSHRSNRVLNGGAAGGGGGDGDSDGSDTDDYGSSDGGGGAGGSGGFGGAGGAGGGRRPSMGRDDADKSSDEDAEDSDEDEAAEAMTDEDSEDDYGAKESSAAARAGRRGVMPAVPARGASIPTAAPEADAAADSDSSDDRPLGQLVDDPKAVQKALRAKERRRHFDMAAKALEGKGSSSATPSSSGHARPAVQQQGKSPDQPVVNPNELSQRLNRVQQRRERAHAPNGAGVQRSQTVARPDGERPAAAVSRSKSVRTAPAERYAHPGMRARTPSEAALRAKAMTQAGPHGPSPISPTPPQFAMMPELPSNAMATVVAAQKAMAMAQANPTPASLAQAQALATSATAALNAATAQVKRGGPSPVATTFNHGQLGEQTTTSPRMMDGVELPGARHRTDSRGQTLPFGSSGGGSSAIPATAPTHQPGVLQRLRSRSVSRNQVPLTINTAAAPPLPDLPRPDTASKDSQASSSPRSAHTATFAALAQAAAHHGRPSGDGSMAHGDTSMHRNASAQHTNAAPTSNESGSSLHVTSIVPRQPHKVFILSRQRFTVVEVPVSARARDLALEVIERERLPMDDSKGGWVVFDCSAQLGIERPLREYEMITDVVNVRAHPKTDFLLIKRTELSPYLSLRSVPSSSPALAGWVYVQDRKKKWNKRWLELRDHGLYHAKNEKGKDEMSICQISTFDVYLVDSSAVKMPKANGFALRSQDPITMFEKPDQDYVHYFSLTDPAAHRDWVRAILNARTYILRQEKAILFQVESPLSSQEAAPGVTASGGLARAMTSRRPPNTRAAEGASESGHGSASGPSPLIDSSAFAGPFAKGSLLADKAISDAKVALRGHAPGAPVTGAFNELSLMDQQALRSNEARRREEAAERQRRMKAEGQPLIDLVRK
uniref:PH domain-containing protein n=1 Tax=Kalmanozyma brasiliensis (strain GHG001) TaxID=1365824 RepID=V5ES07_KALBG